ncbi:MAG TPA: hypothetical protein VMH39_08965 [Gemmatimonadaceae bacterium]|nr:hypothetical protein [Gemmatimonadaceae bacterium]
MTINDLLDALLAYAEKIRGPAVGRIHQEAAAELHRALSAFRSPPTPAPEPEATPSEPEPADATPEA